MTRWRICKEHHQDIIILHLKDRKRPEMTGPTCHGASGDTLIKPVLPILLKQKKWPIPSNIEYEYGKPGMDSVAEVKKCVEYCKKALA